MNFICKDCFVDLALHPWSSLYCKVIYAQLQTRNISLKRFTFWPQDSKTVANCIGMALCISQETDIQTARTDRQKDSECVKYIWNYNKNNMKPFNEMYI